MSGDADRYQKSERRVMTGPDGRPIGYFAPRLAPVDGAIEPERTLARRTPDRIDWMAARALGDPLQFWRLADVNGVVDPFELLRVPPPLAIPRPGPGD